MVVVSVDFGPTVYVWADAGGSGSVRRGAIAYLSSVVDPPAP